jgi:hypothetical protein
MATITLTPNGEISESGWTRTGGSSSHGVLSDASDATYMTETTVNNDAEMVLDLTTASLNGEVVTAVAVRLRHALVSGTSGVLTAFVSHPVRETILSQVTFTPGTIQDETLSNFTILPHESDIAALRLTIGGGGSIGGSADGPVRVYEAAVILTTEAITGCEVGLRAG